MQDANRDWRLAGAGIGAVVGSSGDRMMPINLETTVEAYLKAKNLSQGTRDEYRATLRKWKQWRGSATLVEIDRKIVRDFLDRVYEQAIEDDGTNPGRTANKSRESLRAVMSWAWEQDMIESLPRFPRPRPQRDVAGRHYLTKAELNALYFATYRMKRPRGWDAPFTVGHYWRCALVLFFNYGMDTGTLWQNAGLPQTTPVATCLLGTRVARWSTERTVSLGLAVLQTSQNQEDISPSDEPGRARTPQEYSAGRA